MKIITSLQDISAPWLENILNLDTGTIKSYKISRTWDMAISLAVIVSIEYHQQDENRPKSIFFKLTKPDLHKKLTEAGRNEIYFYNDVLPKMKGNIYPHCFFAGYDDDNQHYNLVLEDLSATHYQTNWPLTPSMDSCRMAVSCIAQVHASLWDRPELKSLTGKFLSADTPAARKSELQEIADEFVAFMDDRFSEKRKTILYRYIAKMEKLGKRDSRQRHVTITHNDAHFWNFMYPKTSENSIMIIDWHFFGQGVGTDDLAYMLAVSMFPERRQLHESSWLKLYHETISEQGVKNYSMDDLSLDYRYSVISSLTLPIYQWYNKVWDGIWYHNLERIFSAFDDLNCAELLGE